VITTRRERSQSAAAVLDAVAFGGFVAFSVPTTAYHLERGDAALRTAGFVVLAVAVRPIGGWLSDRFSPIAVLLSAYGAAALLALIAAFEFPLVPVGTVAFLGLAAALGTGTGAVFALLAGLVASERVGP
jgi:NNP family nitrate/nitrite transporter-like MFS transporter